MDIDIEPIKQAFSTLSTVLATFKQARELFPEGRKKKDLSEALEQAERQLKLAESQAAQGLGYELCVNHFPPEIMLSGDKNNWKCPVCNSERYTGPVSVMGSAADRLKGRTRKKSLFHD